MPRGKKTKERKILATVLETCYESLCIAVFKNTISDRAGIWTMSIIKNILLTRIEETQFIFKYDLCVYVRMFISHQLQAQTGQFKT